MGDALRQGEPDIGGHRRASLARHVGAASHIAILISVFNFENAAATARLLRERLRVACAVCITEKLLKVPGNAGLLAIVLLACHLRVGANRICLRNNSEQLRHRMSAQSQPATGRHPGGRPIGSQHARAVMRERLIAAYVEALGGADRVNLIQMQDVTRCADLVLLAAETRDAVRRGAAKVADMTRLEGAADRAQRRLNLRPPGAAAPGDDAWRKFLASHQHADGDG